MTRAPWKGGMIRSRIVFWTVYLTGFAVWYAVSRNSVMLIPVAIGCVMLPVSMIERRLRRPRKKGLWRLRNKNKIK